MRLSGDKGVRHAHCFAVARARCRCPGDAGAVRQRRGGWRLGAGGDPARDRPGRWRLAAAARSEEHTSELQSLMRISYAVFCLKKKNNNTIYETYQPIKLFYNAN